MVNAEEGLIYHQKWLKPHLAWMSKAGDLHRKGMNHRLTLGMLTSNCWAALYLAARIQPLWQRQKPGVALYWRQTTSVVHIGISWYLLNGSVQPQPFRCLWVPLTCDPPASISGHRWLAWEPQFEGGSFDFSSPRSFSSHQLCRSEKSLLTWIVPWAPSLCRTWWFWDFDKQNCKVGQSRLLLLWRPLKCLFVIFSKKWKNQQAVMRGTAPGSANSGGFHGFSGPDFSRSLPDPKEFIRGGEGNRQLAPLQMDRLLWITGIHGVLSRVSMFAMDAPAGSSDAWGYSSFGRCHAYTLGLLLWVVCFGILLGEFDEVSWFSVKVALHLVRKGILFFSSGLWCGVHTVWASQAIDAEQKSRNFLCKDLKLAVSNETCGFISASGDRLSYAGDGQSCSPPCQRKPQQDQRSSEMWANWKTHLVFDQICCSST